MAVLLSSCKSLNVNNIIKKRDCKYTDTININSFVTSDDYNVSGKRLYPDPCLSDEDALKIAEKTHVYLILEHIDTLFVFSNKKIFSYNLDSNDYLPNFREDIITTFYKNKKYEIIKDPDPPKWTAIQNNKDTIIVSIDKVHKKYRPEFVYGIIQDTIIRFANDTKIGIDKNLFFKKNLEFFTYNKRNFTLIYTSIYESNVSWYYKYFESTKKNKFRKGKLKYEFTFKNNKLIKIRIYS